MRKLLALAALGLAASAHAQTSGNPLLQAAQAIGAKGLGAETLESKTGWPFKASGNRPTVKAYVAGLTAETKEREALEEGINAVIDKYETLAKSLGQPNDPATALAFSVAILTSTAKGEPLDDAAFVALIPRLRATLARTSATDAQKQEFYELALSTSGMVASLAAVAGPDKTKALAEAGLLSLIGAKPDAVQLKGKEVAIVGVAPTATSSALHVESPAGWRKDGVWTIGEVVDGSNVHAAQVRLPPAVPAKGSFSDALRAAWKQFVPEPLQDKASGMVFRRYVGDGLVAQFVCGSGVEPGRKWETLFTVYLVDCGSTWQPVVVAQTWADRTSTNPIYSPWTISGSFRQSSALVETFLKGLSSPAAKGRPLVDRAAIAGVYNYGSSSYLQYVNIYSGATSASSVSYGGTLTLHADNTFEEDYSSASGIVGNLKFRGFKAKGSWSLKGEILTLTDSFYDQGDGVKRKPKTFRVAGIVSFSDGEKVLVLKSKIDEPVNPQTVGDRSEYYTTAKKK